MNDLLKFLLGAFLGVSAVARASDAPLLPPQEAIKDWAAVLEIYVDERGYVDFAGLERDPAALVRYTDWVAAVDPSHHPEWFPGEQSLIAHHINAYNALAMRHVLTNGLPKRLTPLRRLKFFRTSRVAVGTRQMSLEDYENDIIRKLNESRIHVALNCMSESCPRLPRVPFSADALDAQLDAESFKFFAEGRNVRVDTAKRSVYLTEIMKFFTEDFLADAPTLIAYANRYRNEPIPEDFKVQFIPYDWTIIHR
jgi:hypothetical protein